MKVRYLLIAILTIFLIFGISNMVFAADEPFKLDKNSIEIKLNSSGILNYTGGSGTTTWKSSDESIVTVDNIGILEGKKIGTATITATNGTESATCTVNVVYYSIGIGGNYGDNVSKVNLVLNEHDTENLYATVKDGMYNKVNNPSVTWSSSNESVVTVDKNTGTIKGLKAGTATITATAAGVTKTCEVTVVNGPKFTDFSKAKFELLFDIDTDLKISGITPTKENHNYYYLITPDNKKPTITIDNDGKFVENETEGADSLFINEKDKYIFKTNVDQYVEKNQDLYLWVIETVKLDADYAISGEKYNVYYSTKFAVEGKKLTRPKLPQLNLIMKSISIWGGFESGDNTYINFTFPSATEKRKFNLKIGKVTDNSILNKIQKNDYTGITELLTYAKKNKAVYTSNLTTTRECYYSIDKALFDGRKLLEDKAYYYIYVQFDDENGKYYPIEGVTLGQAWFSSSNSKMWDIYAYTTNNFKWNNLTTTSTETDNKKDTNTKKENTVKNETKNNEKDNTVADKKIPYAGRSAIIIMVVIAIMSVIVFYYKNNEYKDVK